MFVFGQFWMLLFGLFSSKIRGFNDGLMADAICFIANFRRSDVCNKAILECYCTIFFLLKYDGLVMVCKPMQFLPLSIYVGQMFAMKQFWNVIVRSYSFYNTTVQWWFANRCNFSHFQFPSVRCLYLVNSECYCSVFFLLKYGGSTMVWWPMQFVSLPISVGQMFAMKQFWNVIIRSYSFLITTVQ